MTCAAPHANPIDRLLAIAGSLDDHEIADWLRAAVMRHVNSSESLDRALGLSGSLGVSPRFDYLRRERNRHLATALICVGGDYAQLAAEIQLFKNRLLNVWIDRADPPSDWQPVRVAIHRAFRVMKVVPATDEGLRLALDADDCTPLCRRRQRAHNRAPLTFMEKQMGYYNKQKLLALMERRRAAHLNLTDLSERLREANAERETAKNRIQTDTRSSYLPDGFLSRMLALSTDDALRLSADQVQTYEVQSGENVRSFHTGVNFGIYRRYIQARDKAARLNEALADAQKNFDEQYGIVASLRDAVREWGFVDPELEL